MAKPRSYHHGNLKQALLKASLELIRKSGAGAFTLREVARMAGVSHNAPYRHFRDKEDLLAALAAEGFDLLTAAMVKAAGSASGAMERFRLSGRGYVEFALRYPQHFAVMFDAPWPRDPHHQCHGRRASGRLRTLVGYVEACQARGDSCRRETPGHFALLAWSMVHGVAKLAISGRLPMTKAADVLNFTDTATGALTRGLANAFVPKP